MQTVNQVQQLKLNVTTIKSVLVASNKQYRKLKTKNKELVRRQIDTEKRKKEEEKLESPIGNATSNIKKVIAKTPLLGLLDKILGFGSLVLAGILVNALPGIIKKVREFIDTVVNVVTPIMSGFTLLKTIITGEDLKDPDLDPDKKRVTEEIKKIKKSVDKVKADFGMFGFALTPIQAFIDAMIKYIGGDKIVLAEKTITDPNTGKTTTVEGFKNLETGEFIKKSFTEAERARFRSGDTSVSSTSAGNVSKLGSGKGTIKSLTDKDFSDLAYAVSGEAQRGTNDEFGVAANILTRVADPNYPNTIMGVFTQGTASNPQYEAYWNGGARRDPDLAEKLKSNKDKIAAAMKLLNGRQDFKGTSEYGNMGKGDIKFSDRGNFYHYASQTGKNVPPPTSPPQYWRKFIGSSSNPSISSSSSLLNIKTEQLTSINQEDPANSESESQTFILQKIVENQLIPQPYPVFSSSQVSTFGGDQLNSIWFRELTN